MSFLFNFYSKVATLKYSTVVVIVVGRTENLEENKMKDKHIESTSTCTHIMCSAFYALVSNIRSHVHFGIVEKWDAFFGMEFTANKKLFISTILLPNSMEFFLLLLLLRRFRQSVLSHSAAPKTLSVQRKEGAFNINRDLTWMTMISKKPCQI